MNFCRWPKKIGFLYLPLPQVVQTNAEQDNVGELLEDDEIKESKSDKENTSKLYVCNICGNSFMYEEGLIDHDSQQSQQLHNL